MRRPSVEWLSTSRGSRWMIGDWGLKAKRGALMVSWEQRSVTACWRIKKSGQCSRCQDIRLRGQCFVTALRETQHGLMFSLRSGSVLVKHRQSYKQLKTRLSRLTTREVDRQRSRRYMAGRVLRRYT